MDAKLCKITQDDKMETHNSPFKNDFDVNLILKTNDKTSEPHQVQNEDLEFLRVLLKWLCTPPKMTSFRVNTLTHTPDEVFGRIRKFALEIAGRTGRAVPGVVKHPLLPEVIVMHHWDTSESDFRRHLKEVIVDVHCAAAVLRGAHIFAPGIMAMQSGTKYGDIVSIYADVSKKCKKGYQKTYEDENRVFVGNGIVKMVRHELFRENLSPSGVAVEVLENTAGCPPLDDFLPCGSAILQNLPSVVCVRVLNPTEGDVILDMCASPGNKTTHICALTKNKATVVAIDKTPRKVQVLKTTCEKFSANVHCFQADSTKIYDPNAEKRPVSAGPPFSGGSFDKVLLDAPCSALGKRPQLYNAITQKEVQSYVPLQRKLFKNAVNLLKPNGILVYSTCTVTVAENEGIVSWALKTYPSLRLVEARPHLGGPGYKNTENSSKVQRFGPNQQVDSVGFFIASFISEAQD